MKAPINIPSIILSLLLMLLTTNLAGQPDPALVYTGENGQLVYVKHANIQETNADNLVIDYSHCGFMGGGVAIPDVPVKATIYPRFGDDQERIQAAIDYVSGLEPDENGYRGAVLLKAGTYELGKALLPGDDALQIKASGVVLRGEGQGPGGTVLKTSFETKHRVIATRPERHAAASSNKTRIKDPYVGSGVFGFHVEDASGYSAGDTINVRFTPNQTWLDEIYANAYMSAGDLDWDINTYTINYERIITHVENDSITIHSPVILPMQTKFGGGEIVKLAFSRNRINRVGVENMRLVGPGVTPTCPADDPNRLQTAIRYEHTEHSWIRDITVLHTSNSLFKMWNAHYVTIQDCASIEPLGPKEAGYRYTFYYDAAASHNLCQRTYTDNGRHDYVLGPRIPGPNVFLDGVSQRGGTQGPHQRWATGTLFDNLKMESLIALEHRGSSGSGHSWAGIQSTIWNTKSPTIICDSPTGHMNYAIGNTGTEVLSSYINNTRPGVYRGYYDQHGTHVGPRSLYLAQLEDRLGAGGVENITIPEQRTGNIYDMLLDWKGDGKLTEAGTARLASPVNLSIADLDPTEGSQYIELQWTDNVANETQFILERSADGGTTYAELAALPANTVSYRDEDILQDSYHYRLKAVNETLESGYVYLYADLFDEALYANVTFRVNMMEVKDRYENGAVWLVTNNGDTRIRMTGDDADSIFSLAQDLIIGKNLAFRFAYQNGADSVSNVVTEQVSGDCANNEGYRILTIPEDDRVLVAYLFGSCDVTSGNPGIFLDDCDARTDWNSSADLTLNKTDQIQGNGCIQFSGVGTKEFEKVFSQAYNSFGAEATTELRFWYYVSDVSVHMIQNQVELGSAGRADQDEYNWNLTGLTNGWNYVTLKTSEAGKNGSPDLGAINWFRIYRFKSGPVVSRIDAIQVIDTEVGPLYTLLVNNGSGSGNYPEGHQVGIVANSAPSGMLFDQWTISSGVPAIGDAGAASTTLTMGAGPAVVAATYREEATTVDLAETGGKLKVYPNPAVSEVTVELELQQAALVSVSLFDLSGRAVGSRIADQFMAPGQGTLQLPLQGVTPGTYLLKTRIDGRVHTELLIIR
jgi:hypothetical protein